MHCGLNHVRKKGYNSDVTSKLLASSDHRMVFVIEVITDCKLLTLM
jgi:hypothetical protein